jgi:uncharacterized protein
MATSQVMAREERVAVAGGDVSGLWLRPPDAIAAIALAHGAGAGMRHVFMERLAAALTGEGIASLRYQFPYVEAGRRVPDRPPLLIATVRAAVAHAERLAPELPLLAGGKSLGGRMSSQAAAAGGLAVLGLVFFGFPLHPPKAPAIERAKHLPAVALPMLFLQGTRDALADLSLLGPVCDGLGPRATLHQVIAADHGFGVLKRSGRAGEDVLAELAATTRSWLLGRVLATSGTA